MSDTAPFTIAQISDLHCGSPFFVPTLLDRAIDEVNQLAPKLVVVSGDLTGEGFVGEYELAAEYLAKIECPHVVTIPGNHDSRNVGYVHFEDLIGPRNDVLHFEDLSVVAVDSTEPDLNNGKIGRGRYNWIEQQFRFPAGFRVFVMHHHLLPIPGTGRERNIVYDAGDTLEVLQRAQVDLVLAGHKHVPYAWRLEDMFIVNAGTVSTTRLRGRGRPCYNVISVAANQVTVDMCFPFHGRERIVDFDRQTLAFSKFTPTPTDELGGTARG